VNGTPVPRLTTPLLVVAGFFAAFVATFAYFWTNTGGGLPLQEGPYRVSFETDYVDNLIDRGDVSMAGVKVGQVRIGEAQGNRVRVTLELDGQAAPLHRGATVRVGVKSLVGTSYVDVVDGEGEPLTDGATLDRSAVKEAAGVDDLIETLDPATRQALKRTLRSLGSATAGRSENISQLMDGLGMLGREGHTALDAIAAQSGDLEALTRETTILLNALDTGEGRIVEVVRDAGRLTRATSGQRKALESTMRAMPNLLESARVATHDLGTLSGSLAPVARDLQRSAPDLNQALLELPAVTRDLRGLLPDLDSTLGSAPGTLERVPTLGADLRTLIPEAEVLLRDVNPMLEYLRPYGAEVGSFFANFGAAMDLQLPNGIRPVRLAMIFGEDSLAGKPVPLNLNPFNWTNPYPSPGQANDPAPFEGPYPRLSREPK